MFQVSHAAHPKIAQATQVVNLTVLTIPSLMIATTTRPELREMVLRVTMLKVVMMVRMKVITSSLTISWVDLILLVLTERNY